MQSALRNKMNQIGTPASWNHITDQVGLFSYTGLTLDQCSFLANEKHIYLLKSGRINMSSLSANNIDHVTESMEEAILKFPVSRVSLLLGQRSHLFDEWASGKFRRRLLNFAHADLRFTKLQFINWPFC